MREQTATSPATTPRVVDLPERQTAVVRIDAAVADMPRLFGEAFDLCARAIEAAGAQFAGAPFAWYFGFGERISADVGFPFTGTVQATDRVSISTLPGGRAVTMTHVGPYDALGTAWERGQSWLSGQGLRVNGAPWECYLTGPEEPGPPITEIFWPVQ
jgi:effector-binding domain-containing protein